MHTPNVRAATVPGLELRLPSTADDSLTVRPTLFDFCGLSCSKSVKVNTPADRSAHASVVLPAAANKNGRISDSRMRSMDDHLAMLISSFNGMDKVDKMQFPFPYAQLVKVFLFVYVMSLPFALEVMYTPCLQS